jgi:hypothetical protein
LKDSSHNNGIVSDGKKPPRHMPGVIPFYIMKILKIFSIIIFGAACFFGGIFWQKYKLLESGIYELQEPLTLQSSKGSRGLLPKGTIIYEYSSGPSINTYVTFINTKNINTLKPIRLEHYLTVSPIDGYQD